MYKTSNSMKVNKQEKIIKAKWSDKENLFIPPAYPEQKLIIMDISSHSVIKRRQFSKFE